MLTNEQVIREVYAAAEGKDLDVDKFISLFADDGYVLNVPGGQKCIGQEVHGWFGNYVLE